MLQNEARTSFTHMANECKITVSAVRMRYKRLWKDGIINGEVTLINPHHLGYRHIVDLEITCTVEGEKRVAAFLETKSYISQVFGHSGKFFGKVALRDLNKLSTIIEELESNTEINQIDALIWSEAANIEFPQNLVIKPIKQNNFSKIERPALSDLDKKPIVLDNIDKKIASIISRKARTPFRKIAEQLDITTKTVIQRYEKLREKLFTHSTITLNLDNIGYKALLNLYIIVNNRSKINNIYRQLLQIPNVIVIIRLVGKYDLYVAVVLEDFADLFKKREIISKIDGVEDTQEFLTPAPISWPFNLFPSLLESEVMPKYWTGTNS